MRASSNRNAPTVSDPVICVDMGTTNTRAWLVRAGEVLARRDATVGVRDSARTGTTNVVVNALRDVCQALERHARTAGLNAGLVLGAGMVTSSLGLMELDHVLAPAGENELAANLHELKDPRITALPIWLVPGVRTGPALPAIKDLRDVDVIRGEETLCVGLVKRGILPPSSTLLNLGSHWKAINLDGGNRIASSFTTLSGEMIHVLQQHTVLASALPKDRLREIDFDWLQRGRELQEESGLTRTLFCVRLLEQRFSLTSIQRASFLLGAMVSSDLTALIRNKRLTGQIVIAGSGAPVVCWKRFLQGEGHKARACEPEEIESAFIAGLLRIAELRIETWGNHKTP